MPVNPMIQEYLMKKFRKPSQEEEQQDYLQEVGPQLAGSIANDAAMIGSYQGYTPDASSVGKFADTLSKYRSLRDAKQEKQEAGGIDLLQKQEEHASKEQLARDTLSQSASQFKEKLGETSEHNRNMEGLRQDQIDLTKSIKSEKPSKLEDEYIKHSLPNDKEREELYRWTNINKIVPQLLSSLEKEGTFNIIGSEGSNQELLVGNLKFDLGKMREPGSALLSNELSSIPLNLSPVERKKIAIQKVKDFYAQSKDRHDSWVEAKNELSKQVFGKPTLGYKQPVEIPKDDIPIGTKRNSKSGPVKYVGNGEWEPI